MASTCPVASAGGCPPTRDGHALRAQVHLARDVVVQGFRRLERAAQHAMRRAWRGRCREGLGEDGVLPAGAQDRFHVDGMRRGLLGGQEPRADPRGSRARRQDRGHGSRARDAARGDHRHPDRVEHLVEQRQQADPALVRPPASIPRATTMSHPAASAARASSAEMICQLTSAPPAAARSTSAGVGSPRYSSTSGACAARVSSALSSNSGSMRLTPKLRVCAPASARPLREIGSASPHAGERPGPPAAATERRLRKRGGVSDRRLLGSAPRSDEPPERRRHGNLDRARAVDRPAAVEGAGGRR